MKNMEYDKTVFNKLKDVVAKRGKAVSVVVGNQKGGVGKTANSTLISYILAENGVKTLVIDLDPQANASQTLIHTGIRDAVSRKAPSTEYPMVGKTIMSGIADGDLTDLPVRIKDSLYLLPSYADFEGFVKYLYKHADTEEEESHFLKPLLDPLTKDYDVIILDMPPQIGEVRDNAIVFADFVLISLQTQSGSLKGAEVYIDKLVDLKVKYNLSIELLGLLAVLNNRRGSVDLAIMEQVKNDMGEEIVFSDVVPNMERIKRFHIQGIGEDDRFDTQVLNVYRKVSTEFAQRINDFLG